MRFSLVTILISLITKPYVIICAPVSDITQNTVVRHDEKDNIPASKPFVGVAELDHESILELISLLKEEKERIRNKVNNKGYLLEFKTDKLERQRAWKKSGKDTPRWYPKFRQTSEGERREDNVEFTTTNNKTAKKENKVVVDGNDDNMKTSLKKHNNMLMLMMGKHSGAEWMNGDIGRRRRRNKKTSSSSDMVKLFKSLKRKRNFIASATLPVSFYMAKYQFGKRDTV